MGGLAFLAVIFDDVMQGFLSRRCGFISLVIAQAAWELAIDFGIRGVRKLEFFKDKHEKTDNDYMEEYNVKMSPSGHRFDFGGLLLL